MLNELYNIFQRTLQRSTLFPYTTLFRSRFFNQATSRGLSVQVHPDDDLACVLFYNSQEGYPQLFVQTSEAEDRKSTRLNSSHVRISYAVFCLQKKSMSLRAVAHIKLLIA